MAGDLSEFYKQHIESSKRYGAALDSIINESDLHDISMKFRDYGKSDYVKGKDLESVCDLNTLQIVRDNDGKFQKMPTFGKARPNKSTSNTRTAQSDSKPKLDSNQNVTSLYNSHYCPDAEFEALKDISQHVVSFIGESLSEPSDAETLNSTSSDESIYSDDQEDLPVSGHGRPLAHGSSLSDYGELTRSDHLNKEDSFSEEFDDTASEDEIDGETTGHTLGNKEQRTERKLKGHNEVLLNDTYTVDPRSPRAVNQQWSKKPHRTITTKFTPFDKVRTSKDGGLHFPSNVHYNVDDGCYDDVSEEDVNTEHDRQISHGRPLSRSPGHFRKSGDFRKKSDKKQRQLSAERMCNSKENESHFDNRNRFENSESTSTLTNSTRSIVHSPNINRRVHSPMQFSNDLTPTIRKSYTGNQPLTLTPTHHTDISRGNQPVRDRSERNQPLTLTPSRRTDISRGNQPARDRSERNQPLTLTPTHHTDISRGNQPLTLTPTHHTDISRGNQPVRDRSERNQPTIITPTHHKHAIALLASRKSPILSTGKKSSMNKTDSQHVDSGFSTLHEDQSTLDNISVEKDKEVSAVGEKEVKVLSVKNLKAFNDSITENTSFFNVTEAIKSPERFLQESENINKNVNNWLCKLQVDKQELLADVDHLSSDDLQVPGEYQCPMSDRTGRSGKKESKVEFGEVEHHKIPFSPGKRPPNKLSTKCVIRSPVDEIKRAIVNQNSRQTTQNNSPQLIPDRPLVKKCVRKLNIAETFKQLKTCNAGDLLMSENHENNEKWRQKHSHSAESNKHFVSGKRCIGEINDQEIDSRASSAMSCESVGYQFPSKCRKIHRSGEYDKTEGYLKENEFVKQANHVQNNVLLSPIKYKDVYRDSKHRQWEFQQHYSVEHDFTDKPGGKCDKQIKYRISQSNFNDIAEHNRDKVQHCGDKIRQNQENQHRYIADGRDGPLYYRDEHRQSVDKPHTYIGHHGHYNYRKQENGITTQNCREQQGHVSEIRPTYIDDHKSNHEQYSKDKPRYLRDGHSGNYSRFDYENVQDNQGHDSNKQEHFRERYGQYTDKQGDYYNHDPFRVMQVPTTDNQRFQCNEHDYFRDRHEEERDKQMRYSDKRDHHYDGSFRERHGHHNAAQEHGTYKPNQFRDNLKQDSNEQMQITDKHLKHHEKYGHFVDKNMTSEDKQVSGTDRYYISDRQHVNDIHKERSNTKDLKRDFMSPHRLHATIDRSLKSPNTRSPFSDGRVVSGERRSDSRMSDQYGGNSDSDKLCGNYDRDHPHGHGSRQQYQQHSRSKSIYTDQGEVYEEGDDSDGEFDDTGDSDEESIIIDEIRDKRDTLSPNHNMENFVYSDSKQHQVQTLLQYERDVEKFLQLGKISSHPGTKVTQPLPRKKHDSVWKGDENDGFVKGVLHEALSENIIARMSGSDRDTDLMSPDSRRQSKKHTKENFTSPSVCREKNPEMFSPSVSMAKLKLNTPTSNRKHVSQESPTNFTPQSGKKSVTRKVREHADYKPAAPSDRKVNLTGMMRGNDYLAPGRAKSSSARAIFSPASGQRNEIADKETGTDFDFQALIDLRGHGSLRKTGLTAKKGINRNSDSDLNVDDCDPSDVGFISLDKLSKYAKHIKIKQGQFWNANDDENIGRNSQNAITGAFEADPSSVDDPDELDCDFVKPYKQYYNNVLETDAGHESEKENSRKSLGDSKPSNSGKMISEFQEPTLRKSLFLSKNPLAHEFPVRNYKNIPSSDSSKPNLKTLSQFSKSDFAHKTLNRQVKGQGYFHGNNKQGHFLQSTPVKKGSLLQLNDTMSTILGSEETDKGEEDEILLI